MGNPANVKPKRKNKMLPNFSFWQNGEFQPGLFEKNAFWITPVRPMKSRKAKAKGRQKGVVDKYAKMDSAESRAKRKLRELVGHGQITRRRNSCVDREFSSLVLVRGQNHVGRIREYALVDSGWSGYSAWTFLRHLS